MASLKTLDDELVIAFRDVLGLPETRRFSSDYLDDFDGVLPGDTRYQLQVQGDSETADTNDAFRGANVETVIYHQLLDPFNERAYTLVEMDLLMGLLLDPDFWRDNMTTSIRNVELPALGADVIRDGDNIAFSVTVVAELFP